MVSSALKQDPGKSRDYCKTWNSAFWPEITLHGQASSPCQTFGLRGSVSDKQFLPPQWHFLFPLHFHHSREPRVTPTAETLDTWSPSPFMCDDSRGLKRCWIPPLPHFFFPSLKLSEKELSLTEALKRQVNEWWMINTAVYLCEGREWMF